MLEMSELLSRDRIALDLRATSKRQLLRELAELVAKNLGLDPEQVLEALLKREKLGTTAIGEGIAIPHAKIKDLDHLVGAFARLAKAIDFEAVDEIPVDLVFLLLAPESASSAEHLKALARLARLLRDPELRARLRKEEDIEHIYRLLTERPQSHAA